MVTVDGPVATLTGTVRSRRERESVERAAADGPGITTVVNHLAVEPADADETCDIC
jgi:osmotically-inducible protein OsmY